MIIDMKYHVASLVAVFLALGLGIFIGSTIVGESLVTEIVEQQEGIVSKLEGDFAALKNESKKYQEQITVLEETVQLYKRYAEESIPYLIKNKLMDKRIAIIQNGDLEIPSQFLYNLEIAGAQVISYTKFSQEFYENEKKIDVLVSTFSGMGGEKGDINKHEASLGRVDCVLIVHGNVNSATVNINRFQRIEESLLNRLYEQGIPVYVAKEARYPVNMRLYQEFAVSTVDDIHTIPGQIALILAMAGYHGHYEIKASADFLLPAFNQ